MELWGAPYHAWLASVTSDRGSLHFVSKDHTDTLWRTVGVNHDSRQHAHTHIMLHVVEHFSL